MCVCDGKVNIQSFISLKLIKIETLNFIHNAGLSAQVLFPGFGKNRELILENLELNGE